jgi:hypothetical protein
MAKAGVETGPTFPILNEVTNKSQEPIMVRNLSG